MANIRIGGKTYRDIEKMSDEEITNVGQVMIKEYQRIARIKPNRSNISAIQTAMAYADKQAKILDPFLKKISTKAPE